MTASIRGWAPEVLAGNGRNLRLSVAVDGEPKHEQAIEAAGPFLVQMEVTHGATGWRELSIGVNRSFCPADQGASDDSPQEVTPGRLSCIQSAPSN